MTKKSKCATALLATALLSYGFTLDTTEEATTVEPEQPAEVAVEKTSISPSEEQHLVAEEEIQVEIFEEDLSEPEEETPPQLPTESEPVPSTSPQQATTLTQKQANTREQVDTVIQAEQSREPAINIPEPDSMNGIDYSTSQTIQPDLESRQSYTEEQLTDPSQIPDGTPVEVYVPEVTYPEETTSSDLAYVPGFG